MIFDGNFKTLGKWKTWSKNGISRIYVSNDGAYLEEGDSGLCNLVGNLSKEQIAYVYKHVEKIEFKTLFANLKSNKDKAKAKKAVTKTIEAKFGFGSRPFSTEEMNAMMAEIKAALAELDA